MAANDRYIGIAEETIFGTPVPATKFIDIQDEDLKENTNFGDQEGVADQGGIRKSDIMTMFVDGGWSMWVEPENGMTQLLKALFGQGSSTVVDASTTFDHEFTPLLTADPPSLTARKGFDDGELVAPGQMIESGEFSFEQGGYLKARWDVLGKKAQAALDTIGSPTFSALKSFVAGTGVLQIDAGAVDIRSASVKIANQFEADDFVIGDDTYKRPPKRTRIAVEGSLEWQDFQSAERDKFIAGTMGSLILQGIGALTGDDAFNYEFEIKCDEIQYRELAWPMSSRDVRRMTTGFVALIDPTSGYIVEARVRNKEATII